MAVDQRLETLVDDWDRMNAGQRRRVLDTIFDELVVEDGQLVEATPKPESTDGLDE